MGASLLHCTYQPALVLAVGTLTFLGFRALGAGILRGVRVRLPAPWLGVAAVLLGIQGVMLLVEALGMVHRASRVALVGIAWALLAAGALELLGLLRRGPRGAGAPPAWRTLAAAGVAALALAAALVVALAPSTKIDALSYHMLLPLRIVSDGALRFRLAPWPAAIWPQMSFQVSLTPLYALGVPDAGNVVSWCLSLTLAGFAWRVIRQHGGSAFWAACWVAALCVGLYPVVWHVSSGSHALGDLAVCAMVVAWLDREALLPRAGPGAYSALMGLLTLSAAASKASLVPIAALLVVATAVQLEPWRRGAGRLRGVLGLGLPWLVFYAPILGWTLAASGSPYGPLLATLVPHSVYDASTLGHVFAHQRAVDAEGPGRLAFEAATGYSPLLWLGVLGALLFPGIRRRTRVEGAVLLAFQMSVVALFIYPSVRFLGGVPSGLAVAFAAFAAPAAARRLAALRPAWTAAAAGILLLPWLSVQLYYAEPFVPVSLGLETRARFLEGHLALYRDFVALDRLLPKDAVILCTGYRLPSVYAPRPAYLDEADLPPGRPVYRLLVGRKQTPHATRLGVRGGAGPGAVYTDPQAVLAAYRTPGRPPVLGPIAVVPEAAR